MFDAWGIFKLANISEMNADKFCHIFSCNVVSRQGVQGHSSRCLNSTKSAGIDNIVQITVHFAEMRTS